MDNIYLLIWLVGFVTLILRGYWLASKHEKDTVAYYSDGYPVTKRECLIINNIMLGIIWPLAALFYFICEILWLIHNIIMILVTKIRELITK